MEVQRNKSQSCNAIDIMKFTGAVLVVSIHFAPFGSGENVEFLNFEVQQFLARIAVPFFFMSNGYFLFRKMEYGSFSWEPVKQYLFRLFRLYLIWSAVYFPLAIRRVILDGGSVGAGVVRFVKKFLFSGSYTHLWYLNAAIVGVLIVSALLAAGWEISSILILAGSLYAVGLLAQSYFGVILPLRELTPGLWEGLKQVQDVMETTRNGLFFGFLFIGLGMLCAYREIPCSRNRAFGGFAISLALLNLEALFVKKHNLVLKTDMYILLVPTVFFLFVALLRVLLTDRKVYPLLRKMSSLIFYLHIGVEIALEILFFFMGVDIVHSYLQFPLTLGITMLISLCIIKMSEKENTAWLKILYS